MRAFPLSLESIYDNGPRFCILNAIAGFFHLSLGIGLVYWESRIWGIWFGLSMCFAVLVNIAAFIEAFRYSKKLGISYGLCTLLHISHVLSSLWLLSALPSTEKYKLASFGTPVVFLIMALIQAILTHWHRTVIVPPELGYPFSLENYPFPNKLKGFRWGIGLLGVICFGVGESQFGNGKVMGHCGDPFIGIATGILIWSLYLHKYRRSSCCLVISVIWAVLLAAITIASIVIDNLPRAAVDGNKGSGHAGILALLYNGCFVMAYALKVFLLKEQPQWHFSRSHVDFSKSNSNIIIPMEAYTRGVNKSASALDKINDLEKQNRRLDRGSTEASLKL